MRQSIELASLGNYCRVIAVEKALERRNLSRVKGSHKNKLYRQACSPKAVIGRLY
ncbi:MAG: hypothetical protein AAFW70_02840 [Cyanobacteria bacterium J06635_10]